MLVAVIERAKEREREGGGGEGDKKGGEVKGREVGKDNSFPISFSRGVPTPEPVGVTSPLSEDLMPTIWDALRSAGARNTAPGRIALVGSGSLTHLVSSCSTAGVTLGIMICTSGHGAG